MQQYLVKKATLKGTIAIPPSKSHTLRSILFGSLGKGKSVIHHYLPSPDTLAMVQACRLFRATLEVFSNKIEIQGIDGKPDRTEDVIDAGNSGLVLRFCSAVGALACHPIVITGDHSIRYHRPMKPLLEGLSQLGVSTTSMRGDGYAPLILHGPIQPGKAAIDGEDSQHVSALLIAAAFAEGPIQLDVRHPGEKPWVALTLDWLKKLGIRYKNHAFTRYFLTGNAQYDGFEYEVPGDFSSAAFPLAAALITRSELTLKNLDMHDTQGDKELVHLFQKMGANIEVDEQSKTLRVNGKGELKGIEVDINDFVDAITILAVVACFAEGETHIRNAAISKHKECNRIHCVATELRKMGADITETEEGLIIRPAPLRGAFVHSHHDHRLAMSLVVAGLGAEGETNIAHVDCITKTFPTFMRDFNGLGAHIEEL